MELARIAFAQAAFVRLADRATGSSAVERSHFIDTEAKETSCDLRWTYSILLSTVSIDLTMFDDFRRHSSQGERGRVGGAMLTAAVLYAGLVVVVVRSTTAERAKVIETLTQVAFAPPPPPTPPPAASPPGMVTTERVQNARAKVKRKELTPPDELPTARLKEADGELAPSAATGPLDGFLNGVEGGTGTEAAPKGAVIAPPLPLIPAVAASTNAQPPYSATAKRKEVEGEVVVVFDVLENGTVANIQVVSGPEELRDSVIKTVATWRFRPARRGAQPVRTQLKRSIRFELTE